MFYQIKNPPQWMLDNLLNEDVSAVCPDCRVGVGKPHSRNCDIARCLNTGIQRLQCDCGKCGKDVWTGHWPGIVEAHKRKLVCFDTASRSVMLDINATTIILQMQKRGASEKEIEKALSKYWQTLGGCV